jgi:hypothetical protein
MQTPHLCPAASNNSGIPFRALATSWAASGLIIVIDARIVDKLGIGCPTGRPELLFEVDGSRQNLKAR